MGKDDDFDPDPERLIFDFCDDFRVPRWIKTGTYSECCRCHDKLSSGKTHNCRTCGQLCCSACTVKRHVPERFRVKKNKKGPMRVCLSCVGRAMDSRKEVEPSTGHARRVSAARSQINGVLVIHPPEWLDPSKEPSCHKCMVLFKGSKRVNCRCCGRVFCAECSSKREMPRAFRKKGKSGAVRVCHLCRFLLINGAELSEEPAPPPRQAPPRRLRTMKDGDLSIMWENGQRMLLELREQRATRTLKDIHEELMSSVPELAAHEFDFVCEGRPIWAEHYHIFTQRHLRPILYLRPKSGTAAATAALNREHHSRGLSTFSMRAPKRSLATALYAYAKEGDLTHLDFGKGDDVWVTKKENADWWFGESNGKRGWFPAAYVKAVDHGDDDDDDDGGERKVAPSKSGSTLAVPGAGGGGAGGGGFGGGGGGAPPKKYSVSLPPPPPQQEEEAQAVEQPTPVVAASPAAAAAASALPPPPSFQDFSSGGGPPPPPGGAGAYKAAASSPAPPPVDESSLNDIFKARAALFKK